MQLLPGAPEEKCPITRALADKLWRKNSRKRLTAAREGGNLRSEQNKCSIYAGAKPLPPLFFFAKEEKRQVSPAGEFLFARAKRNQKHA